MKKQTKYLYKIIAVTVITGAILVALSTKNIQFKVEFNTFTPQVEAVE
jgi:hypothetical protein